MDNRPIGVFDSGVGGLTVVREILNALPQEKIIYIGDTARVPWGTRGNKTIIKFSFQLANFLIKKRVKLIVVACHTASSVALQFLYRKVSVPVLGVIEPSVDEAIKKSKVGRIGIIGTPATIRSDAWEKALKKRQPGIKVFSVACPLFVPLVEEGLTNHQVTRIMAKEYLQQLLLKRIDAMILACTHYPLIERTIKGVSKDVCLVNPGKATAHFLKKFLLEEGLSGKNRQPKHQFYFTDISYQALNNLGKFLGKLEFARIREVSL